MHDIEPLIDGKMGEFLTELVEWMAALPPLWAYGIILLVAYGENIIPPVPGDMMIVFGGYLVGIGKLDMLAVIALSTLGGAFGFMTMYAIGYRIGMAVLNPDRLRWLPKEKIKSVRLKLQRWGFGIVVANRFLSGLRSVISLTVGMAHMSPGKTTLYSALSALVWTSMMVFAGDFIGENWEAVSGYLKTYGWFVFAAVVIFTSVQITIYLRRRKGNKDRANEERKNVYNGAETEGSK